jgi:ubiquinone/menaquinone biosynthesis C-methylase UbiE
MQARIPDSAAFFQQSGEDYARFRPRYPVEMYTWLAEQAPGRDLAVDIATGNGQAAVELARHFDQVIAQDAAQGQLDAAQPHPKVVYQRAEAAQTGLPDACADLITVAQALHWFATDAFYAEVRRIARQGAFFAAWGYCDARITSEIDALFEPFHRGVVGPYWPAERALVEAHLRTLPFPFREVEAPPFQLQQRLTREGFVRYIGTWSCTQRYRAATSEDPMPQLDDLLKSAWPENTPMLVRWDLFFRAGYVQ